MEMKGKVIVVTDVDRWLGGMRRLRPKSEAVRKAG